MSRMLFRLSALILITAIDLTTSSGLRAEDIPSNEALFLAENSAAMDKMMVGMAVKPTGAVDVDFAIAMIAHHQGAIDMAVAELRYGTDERLRRIAQEIVVEQGQEIVAMRLALDQRPSSSGPTLAIVPMVHGHAVNSNTSMSNSRVINK